MNWKALNTLPVPVISAKGSIRSPHGAAAVLSVKRAFVWAGFGDAFYAACQWGLLVVLARLGTPEMVGQFSLAFAITAPVVICANLSLRPLQSTDARHQFQFKDYLVLRLTSITLALLIISVLAFQYPTDTALTIAVLGVGKCFESISDLFYGLLQKHERMDLIATSLFLKGLASVAGFVAGFMLLGTVLGGVVGLAMAWLLILVAYDIQKGTQILSRTMDNRHADQTWKLTQTWALCTLALPLGIGVALLSLNANIPRYFIERYWGAGALGQFASMAYIAVAAGMIVNSLGQAMSPRLSQHWASGAFGAFRTLLLKFMVLAGLWGLIGVGVAFVAGSSLMTLLYGTEYANHADTFVWIMGAAAVSHLASVYGYGMTAARIIRSQFVQFAVVAAIGIIAAISLVPSHGLNGAAWAFGASLLAQLVMGAFYLHYSLSCRN